MVVPRLAQFSTLIRVNFSQITVVRRYWQGAAKSVSVSKNRYPKKRLGMKWLGLHGFSELVGW
jgi:hypothetical protein